MRKADVAQLAGVNPADVQEVNVQTVRQALVDRIASITLDVATQEPATYWRVGERFFLDDPFFGEVVDFADLDYDEDVGLHARHWRKRG